MLRSRARNWEKEKRMITGDFLFASIRCFCIRPIVQGVRATPEMRCRHISNRNFYYPVREQEFSFVHYAFHAYKFTMICLELQEKSTTFFTAESPDIFASNCDSVQRTRQVQRAV